MAIRPDRPLTPSPAPSKEPARPETPAAPAKAAEQVLAPDGIVRSAPVGGDLPAILNLLPAQSAYDKAVAKLQQRVDADLALQDRTLPRDLYLRQNYQSLLLTQPQPSNKGTVVMLHGYTAGPWQYAEAAEKFFKAGYNVYVPRLPGHGLMEKNGNPSGARMVDAGDQAYEKFVDSTYQEVAALGGPMHVVGLSGGGGVALRMAEKYPQIRDVVAIAPFVGPSEPARIVNNLLNGLARHSFVKLPQWLDLVPYNRNVLSAPDYATPHTQGTFGNAQAMLSVGTRVDRVSVPVQFITTAGDVLSGAQPVEALYKRSGGDSRNGWYHFPAAEKVPHAMASPRQYAGADKLWDQVFETIESGRLHQREPE